jgi:cyclophilin family peptidyl-prolyl cis-trans isomerase
MVIRKFTMIMGFALSLPVCAASAAFMQEQENKTGSEPKDTEAEAQIDYQALMFEAVDRRDENTFIYEEGLRAGHLNALWHLGQIGTSSTCQKITRDLSYPQKDVRLYAASAAAMCMGNISTPSLALQIDREEDALIKGELYRALGFTGRSDIRGLLIRALAIEKNAETLDGVLEGLMQNIVYSGLTVSDLPDLDYQKLIRLAQKNKAETTAFRSAYLLARIRGLEAHISLSDILDAYQASDFEAVQILLLRTIARYPGSSAKDAFLLKILKEDNPKLRVEAIAGLDNSSSSDALEILRSLITDKALPALERQAAITAMARMNDRDRNIVSRLVELGGDETPWFAVKAVDVGSEIDITLFEGVLTDWLKGDDYYKAFQAMNILTKSDRGKAILADFIDHTDDFVRRREARIALDPSIEARTTARISPEFKDAVANQSQLTLKTKRGDIVIETHPSAPFTANNYVSLAKAGKMDGMLWHRIIPNFVAQAGQKEDQSMYQWGSIREEWGGGTHEVGSVGVATAGKDTGGTQFFINTHRNLHLDGRYTVFGHVTEGMDVVYALQEGDIIESVTVKELPQRNE